MAFIKLFESLAEGSGTRPNPRQIDRKLMELAERDKQIEVTPNFDSRNELRGHVFRRDGRIITTHFEDGQVEGSVALIDKERTGLPIPKRRLPG